jgi:hypothetical protein
MIAELLNRQKVRIGHMVLDMVLDDLAAVPRPMISIIAESIAGEVFQYQHRGGGHSTALRRWNNHLKRQPYES